MRLYKHTNGLHSKSIIEDKEDVTIKGSFQQEDTNILNLNVFYNSSQMYKEKKRQIYKEKLRNLQL